MGGGWVGGNGPVWDWVLSCPGGSKWINLQQHMTKTVDQTWRPSSYDGPGMQPLYMGQSYSSCSWVETL